MKTNRPSHTWKERRFEYIRHEIEKLLSSLPEPVEFRNLIKQALAKSSSSVSTGTIQDRQWSLLPLVVCESIRGHYKEALPASVAIHLFIAAAEVFDDIEDADSSESLSAAYGSAIATNVATTLLILAERSIIQLRGRDVADRTIVRVMDAVNSYYSSACAGQYLDLSLTSEIALSEDRYFKVVRMKSASTPECACHIGALLATENQELIDKFTLFGRNLGMASQIANDIQGIISGIDITKRKITLPIIYFLNLTDSEDHHQLELAFGKSSKVMPEPKRIKELLYNSGAIQYATIKMELYKNMALDILSDAETQGASIERLKLLLE